MEERIHVFISGRVQGVFFRAHTRSWATELGVKGWVRNLQDGRVELVAEGPRHALEELLKRVRVGPPAASVENVRVEWGRATGEFEDFEVRY
jgi:acylphosphatase